jgi:probable F420-dependent oxidoreductase
MQVVAGMSDRLPLSEVGGYAQRVEALGYHTLHVPETVHDGLAVALLALEHTERLRVQTSVTLAFVRSPMLVAYTAWDLQAMSGGRFGLGLGSQIRQNIEGRYSMEWREPIGRMRDYVESLRAIWHSFDTGEPLRYEGEHYRFTRLQPFFNPGPSGHPAPEIWLGGVNERICRLGGTHADGFVTHPTNSSPRYLRELCLPFLRAGERPVQLVTGSPFATGPDADAVAASREHHRQLFGFLLSTPAYRRSLELYGWAELGARLQRMTRDGAWGDLPALVTDEVIDTFLPQATWDELVERVTEWFGGLADGVILPVPGDAGLDDRFAEVIRAVAAVAGSDGASEGV